MGGGGGNITQRLHRAGCSGSGWPVIKKLRAQMQLSRAGGPLPAPCFYSIARLFVSRFSPPPADTGRSHRELSYRLFVRACGRKKGRERER